MWLVIWVVLAILIGYYYKEDEKKRKQCSLKRRAGYGLYFDLYSHICGSGCPGNSANLLFICRIA